MENKVKFSVDNFVDYKDDENIEMAIARTMFLSTRPNCYKFILTEEVLRRDCETIKGKWVTAELNGKDFSEHSDKQNIIGKIGDNAIIDFEYDKDGYLCAYTDVIISKLYATDSYELLKSNNYRSVSVEMLTIEDDSKIIEKFNICTITVLGLKYKPAIENASIQLTRFSEEAELFYDNRKKNITTLENKVDDILKILNNNGGINNMAEKEKEVSTETPVEKPKEKEKVVDKELVEDTDKKPNGKDLEKDADKKEKDKIDNKELVEDKKCIKELSDKIVELENDIFNSNELISQLQSFKNESLESQKMAIVNQTLANVKEDLTPEKFSEFSESIKDYSFDTIKSWQNEVKSFAYDNKIGKVGQREKNITRMSQDIFSQKTGKEEVNIFDERLSKNKNN